MAAASILDFDAEARTLFAGLRSPTEPRTYNDLDPIYADQNSGAGRCVPQTQASR